MDKPDARFPLPLCMAPTVQEHMTQALALALSSKAAVPGYNKDKEDISNLPQESTKEF